MAFILTGITNFSRLNVYAEMGAVFRPSDSSYRMTSLSVTIPTTSGQIRTNENLTLSISSYSSLQKRYMMAPEEVRIMAFMQRMAEAVSTTAATLNGEQIIAFCHELQSAKRVYVTGAGRSGFVARAFAMRLMHLGYDAYVVGETITPAFHSGDLLIAFSGSGETHSILSVCETAKSIGGKVCLITASPDSSISRMSDCVVSLGDLSGYYNRDTHTFEVRQLAGKYRSVTSAFAPLGTLFETLALVFSDAVISSLMEEKKEDIPHIRDRLTNME